MPEDGQIKEIEQEKNMQPAQAPELNADKEQGWSDAPGQSAFSRGSLKAVLESLLFINEKPVDTKEIIEVLEVDKKEIEAAMDELAEEYKQRGSGICIVKVAGGRQMCSSPDNETWVKKMYRQRNKQKLSLPALETLAIISYKQPITKMEIEAIRGVSADGVIRNILSAGLIKMEGRKEVVGRPFLYVTTRKFLEYFGLNSLNDLPGLEEFAAIVKKDGLSETSPLFPAVGSKDASLPGTLPEGKDENARHALQDETASIASDDEDLDEEDDEGDEEEDEE